MRGRRADRSPLPDVPQARRAPDATGRVATFPIWRGWGWLVPTAISLGLLAMLAPGDLLRATTPAGFDFAGHVYPLSRAVEHALPAGHLLGWDTGWFGGFPFYFFYFPLCGLLVAAMAPLTGLLVAVKLVSVVGVLALPFAVMWLLRELRLSERAAAVALPVAVTFSITTFNEMGGNVASTLAGEFSYGLSFSLSIAYLAALLRGLRRGSRVGGVLPGVLLGLTVLSHVVTAFVVVLATAAGLLRKRTWRTLVASWVVGFVVCAWWALPFVLRLPYSYGIPVPQPLRILAPLYLVPLFPLAVVGAVQARGRVAHLWLPLTLGATALAVFLLPQHAESAGRVLPYWYLSICLAAGLAAGLYFERALSRRSAAIAAVPLLALLPLAAAVPVVAEYHAWATWDYSGLEAKPAWREVEPLVAALSAAPAGRVYWEHDAKRLAMLGSVNIFTLLPYWSPAHPALRGVWQQSSPLTAALERLDAQIQAAAATADPARSAAGWGAAVGELQRLGVRYFITVREGSAVALARVPGARPLVVGAHLALFALPEPTLVRRAAGGAGIDHVTISESEIRFHTRWPGEPHTVAVPFFPNWRAVTGARQLRPGRDRLIEVVPTGPNVVLEYRTGWPERLGAGISGAGLAALVGGLLALGLRRGGGGGAGGGDRSA